jgi:iron complex outermembrane receptor protein
MSQSLQRNTLLAAAIAAALLPLTALAAERLDAVVVSATRTDSPGLDIPAGISVISRQDIERSGARSVADLLRSRGGLHVSDLFGDGAFSTVDARGFGATAVSNTLILVDGRPLNHGSDIGQIDLGALDLERIERVEIVQGSAGVLYGNQAVGGLVNIILRPPAASGAELAAHAGSYGAQGLKGRATLRLDNGMTLAAHARAGGTDNYRRHNRAHSDSAGARLDVPLPGGGLLFAEHERSAEDAQTPGALFRDELEADRRQSPAIYAQDFIATDTASTRLGLKQALTPRWRFEGELTWRENERDFIQSFRFAAGTLSTQRREVFTFNPRLLGTADCPAGACQFTLGADYEATVYKLLTAFGPQEDDQRITGWYAQTVLPLTAGLSATLGGRAAQVKNNILGGGPPVARFQLDDHVSAASAGLVWRPGGDWRLFARADGNFRFAKVDEHTNVAFAQPVGLKNQRGTSYEAGAEWQRGGAAYKAVAWQLDLKDEIAFDGNAFNININLPATQRRGLMLEARQPLGHDWEAQAAWTLTLPRIESGPHAGKEVPLVPRQHALIGANWRALPGLNLHGEAVLVGSQVNGGDFANAFPRLPAYATLNLAARWQATKGLSLEARVNNLLDRKYSETGATGLDATFTTRDAYQPAPERNALLSLRYAF